MKTSNISITCCTRERQKPGQGCFIFSKYTDRAMKKLFMLQVDKFILPVLCALNY